MLLTTTSEGNKLVSLGNKRGEGTELVIHHKAIVATTLHSNNASMYLEGNIDIVTPERVSYDSLESELKVNILKAKPIRDFNIKLVVNLTNK